MYSRRNIAVSEVLGLILIFTIVTSSVSFIVFWGTPYMETEKARNRMESAKTQFIMMSEVVKDDVVGQGFNSSAVIGFTTDAGEVSINSGELRFIYYYSLKPDIVFNLSLLGDDDDAWFRLMIDWIGGIWETGSGILEVYYLYLHDYEAPVLPDETWVVDDGAGGPIESNNYWFRDAVKMVIKDPDGEEVGHIWLFDTGCVSYEVTSPSGIYKVINRNGGVVAGKDRDGYLWGKPSVKISDSSLSMRVIRFRPISATGGSGSGDYQFVIKLNSTYSHVMESRAAVCGHFKMQIYGDDISVTAWENYFKNERGFGEYDEWPAEGTLFLSGDRSFSLAYSFCDIDLKAGVLV
jgi:hypothetical protein